MTVGGLGAGILSVLGWMLWRKRKIEERINSESMFANASQITMPDPESVLSVPVLDLDNSSAYDVGTVGESSFISDFTPSDFDAFDTDQSEVDPLSEADVYLAYARYQQAEELIRNALEQEPDKDAFKLKLLEIFYAGENKKSFTEYAQELAAKGKQTDPVFWGKVCEMAKEIVPDLPLFSGTAIPDSLLAKPESEPALTSSQADFGEAEFGIDNYDLDDLNSFSSTVDFSSLEDLSAELSDLELDSENTSLIHNNSLDFDTSAFFEKSADQNQEKTAPAVSADIESIDFHSSSLPLEKTIEQSEVKNNQSVIESFDFNFDIDDIETTEVMTGKPETNADLNPDQHSGTVISEPEIVSSPNELQIAEDETIGDFDFNFDFGVPVIDGKEYDEFELSVSDLTDMDEFETKIDLAKAYVDMGDAESAKMIAEEVRMKGSKEQQAIAQSLLDELK